MLKQSAAYQAAITADARRILLRAAVDITDPDLQYLPVTYSSAAPFSKGDQLHDGEMELYRDYTTLEANRWILGVTSAAIPDDPAALEGQIGYVGDVVSGEDGTFPMTVYVEQPFEGVDVLQACSIYFPENPMDGVAEDFTVEILQGGTAYHTEEVSGNTASSVNITGFTVNNPDAIRVTIHKWSLPGRIARVAEIVAGIFEQWDGRMIAEMAVTMQSSISSLALPYGTCTLVLNNHDRRFEWRNKSGLFLSLQERQGITIELGARLADGSVEYKRLGIFYQQGNGWKTSDYDITLTWNLVDVIGLLTKRTFIPPDTLPTTLSGWVAALVANLGTNFTGNYHVDPEYADLSVTANSREEVTGKKCGDILRWACQVTGTWPRAAADTGYLTVEPLWNEGNALKLSQLYNYPTVKANDDIALLIFNLHDGKETQIMVSGTNASSSESVTIDNPFLHTKEQALAAAKMILSTYGGNIIETEGRGDPSSEIGDVDTVWLTKGNATTGRRIYQTFNIQDGVLQGCQSTLLQADGSFLYQNRVQISKSGTFSFPAGVTSARIILVGKGGDGQDGADGGGSPITGQVPGADGTDGSGGLVWYGTINFNDGQSFDVTIGEDTVFGSYSSANGQTYANGYTDLANGETYARTGVSTPRAGSGDGGKGGQGGSGGMWHSESRPIYNEKGEQIGWEFYSVVDVEPGEGTPGSKGAYGCVIAYYDKE